MLVSFFEEENLNVEKWNLWNPKERERMSFPPKIPRTSRKLSFLLALLGVKDTNDLKTLLQICKTQNK